MLSECRLLSEPPLQSVHVAQIQELWASKSKDMKEDSNYGVIDESIVWCSLTRIL